MYVSIICIPCIYGWSKKDELGSAKLEREETEGKSVILKADILCNKRCKQTKMRQLKHPSIKPPINLTHTVYTVIIISLSLAN